MLKKIMILVAASLYCASLSQAQMANLENPDVNPENYDVDNIYYHVGVYFGLSQAVAVDLKQISISGPMEHDIALTYKDVFETVIKRRGLKQYHEDDFLVTDMFPPEYTRDKSVFIVYKKDSVIEDYIALKERKAELIETGKYDQAGRREIAVKLGKLLSYTDETIDEYIKKNAT